VVTVAACGGGTAVATRSDPSSTPTSTVTIDTFMFMPRVVHLHVGDTLTWTNRDDILHTVTSGTREYAPGNGGAVTSTHKDGLFDLQLDGRGATATFTFTAAGTHHYFCDRHPGMEAEVDVS
jgi:plastocyanin